MYTKSILVSALLAASAAATSHEVVATPPSAHQVPPPPPAAMVHEAAPVAAQMPPPPPPMAHNAVTPPAPSHQMAPPAHQVAPSMGMQHQQLTVFLVSVGDNNGSLKYFPDTVHAPPGSVVQFQFHPKNHTITESTFDAPCKAKDPSLATAQRPGLKSGFVPVTGSEETTPVYNVLINDTAPIWIFCGQQPHCIKGMSMVINPPMDNPEKTIGKYQEAAAKIAPPPAAGPPAGAPPAGVSPPPFAGGATPPPPSAPTGISAAPPSSPPSPPSPPSGPPANPAAAQGSNTEPAPATFTGAASRTTFGLGALLLGVVAML